MAYKQRQLLFDGRKAIDPWDLDSNVGWTLLSGEDGLRGLDLYFARVPWLYRGVKDRAQNVAAMPWAILNGDSELATSDKWSSDTPEDLKWFTKPRRLLAQLEMSLAMFGKAYVFLEVNPAGYIKAAKYCAPSTIVPVIDTKTGELTGYKRYINGKTLDCTPADKPRINDQGVIVAIFDPDHNAEVGPAKSSAALAALSAAGVLYSADDFVEKFMSRGAIKASILSVEGGNDNEVKRLERWWEDVVAGVKNAWSAVVLRGKAAAPIVVGEGLENLQNDSLSTSRRQDICTALGVPESRLWSAAANYATRDADEKAYYRGVIIPEFDLVAEVFNEQVFSEQFHLDGYRIENRHEKLEVFQVEEADRADSLKALTDAGIPLLVAMEILGFDLSPEQWEKIKAEEEKPAPVPPQFQAPATTQPAEPVEPADQQEPAAPPALTPDQRKELDIWRRKAIKAVKEGKGACEFEIHYLDAETADGIRAGLEACQTVEDVKAVFDRDDAAVKTDPILALVEEIRLARLAVEAVEE